MKRFLLSILFLHRGVVEAQNNNVIIDQLQSTSTAAFTILGISPHNIERPKNPTDFSLGLGNATSGFTNVPKDYGVEIAPFWVFGKKQTTYNDFMSNNAGKNILQTATISSATTSAKSQIDAKEFRKVAVAAKFSIFRGYLGEEFKKWNDSISIFLHRLSEISGQREADFAVESNLKRNSFKDSLVAAKNEMDKKRWSDSLQIFQDSFQVRFDRFQIVSKMRLDSIKEYQEGIKQLTVLASRTDFKRYGFKLDYALGTAMDYPDSNFQNCYVSKFSTWLTLGWESPEMNFLMLGGFSENLNHYLKNDSNKIVNNINYGDFEYGFRAYKDFTEKLTMSVEYLRRYPIFNTEKFQKNIVSPPNSTSRYVVSFNYEVGKNQNLSFVFGRNFDNTYLQQGNMLAALNFLIGLGSSRPATPLSQ